MLIYVLRAKGVYWKDIKGVFTDYDKAVEVCNKKAQEDIDDYHEWCITEHKVEEVSASGDLDDIHECIYSKRKIIPMYHFVQYTKSGDYVVHGKSKGHNYIENLPEIFCKADLAQIEPRNLYLIESTFNIKLNDWSRYGFIKASNKV